MKEKLPLLTVILPAYNVEKYIEQCIKSILDQTFANFELLISDDGSVDSTKNIIDSFQDERIRVFHNQYNMGKTATVNKLFLESKGKYLTVHDSDDWSDITRFEKQIAWLEQDEKHIMCGTSYRSYDLDLNVIEIFKPLTKHDALSKAIKKSGQFHGPTMMFRKNALDDDQIYRPYFRDNYEDTDLAYRLFKKGICTNLVEPLYQYRILETSLCRKQYTIRNSHLYEVVVHLAKQRDDFGIDDLTKGEYQAVDKYFEEITMHYGDDKSLIFREGASYYMYWKYYQKAIDYSLKAIKNNPWKIINWRTLLYCVRKGISRD